MEELNQSTWVGFILGSPIAFAKIKEISYPKFDDAHYWIVEPSQLGENNSLEWGGGTLPILSGNEIVYKGEPILLVAAENPDLLYTILDSLEIQFEPLSQERKRELEEKTLLTKFDLNLPQDLASSSTVSAEEAERKEEGEEGSKREREPLLRVEREETIRPFQIEMEGRVQVYFDRKENHYTVVSNSRWQKRSKENLLRILKISPSQLTFSNKTEKNKETFSDQYWYEEHQMLCAALLSLRSQQSITLLTRVREIQHPRLQTPRFYGKYSLHYENNTLVGRVQFELILGKGHLGWREFRDRILALSLGNLRWHHVHLSLAIYEDRSIPPSVITPYFGSEQTVFFLQWATGALLGSSPKSFTKPYQSLFFSNQEKTLWQAPSQKEQKPNLLLEQHWKKRDFLRKRLISSFYHSSQYSQQSQQQSQNQYQSQYRQYGIGSAYLDFPLYPNTLSESGWQRFVLEGRLDEDDSLTFSLPTRIGNSTILLAWRNWISEYLETAEEKIHFDEKINTSFSTGPLFCDQETAQYFTLLRSVCSTLKQQRTEKKRPISVKKRQELHRKEVVSYFVDDKEKNFFLSKEPGGGNCIVEIEYNSLYQEIVIQRISYFLERPLLSQRVVREEILHQTHLLLRRLIQHILDSQFPQITSIIGTNPKISVEFLPKKISQKPLLSPTACVYLTTPAALNLAIESLFEKPFSLWGGGLLKNVD